MRTLYNILAVILFLSATAFLNTGTQADEIQDCAKKAGSNAIYLKDFQVSLPASQPDQKPEMYRQAVVLRGNTVYRFNICNNKGEAVIRLYDSSQMLFSSYDPATKREQNPIQFLCRKTGPYNIVITFKDGKAGEAIGIMSHVQISSSRRSSR
jgi:hypothetical protein